MVDPAQPANQFAYPGTDSRFVGVELHIQNTGSDVLSGNAAGVTFAQGSNGESYSAVATPVASARTTTRGSTWSRPAARKWPASHSQFPRECTL